MAATARIHSYHRAYWLVLAAVGILCAAFATREGKPPEGVAARSSAIVEGESQVAKPRQQVASSAPDTLSLVQRTVVGIFGVVRSADGRAIPGAIVCALDAPASCCSSEQCTTTDAVGRYVFDGVAPDVATVLASAPGHLSRSLPLLGWDKTKSRELNVVLPPAENEVAGVVLDAMGGVVTDAMVTASIDAGAVVASSMTDSAGRFRLGVPEGDVEVQVEAPAYSRVTRRVQSPRHGLDIVLTPACTISGRVIANGTNSGIADAWVTAIAAPVAVSQPRPVRSREDGSFEIRAVGLGTYDIVAVGRESRGHAEVTVGMGDAARDVVVIAHPAATLDATLYVDGEPCRSGVAAVNGTITEARPLQSDGKVSFEGLPPGRYLANFSCSTGPDAEDPEQREGARPMRGSLGGEELVEIAAEPVLRAWHLTAESSFRRPRAEGFGTLRVTIGTHADADARAFSAILTTDRDEGALRGNWQGEVLMFSRLALGRYILYLEQAPAQRVPIALQRDGQTVDVVLPVPARASISGHVVDAQSNPVPDVWVQAFESQSAFAGSEASATPVLTDSDGAFVIDVLASTYRLVAQGPSGVASLEDVSTSSDDIVLHLTARESLEAQQ